MSHVLLVELADDLCLFLPPAVCAAGQQTTIVSIAEASKVLHGHDTVDFVATKALLPDGSGPVSVRDATQPGKLFVVSRLSRTFMDMSDPRGVVFRSGQSAVGEFLQRTNLSRRGEMPAEARG